MEALGVGRLVVPADESDYGTVTQAEVERCLRELIDIEGGPPECRTLATKLQDEQSLATAEVFLRDNALTSTATTVMVN